MTPAPPSFQSTKSFRAQRVDDSPRSSPASRTALNPHGEDHAAKQRVGCKRGPQKAMSCRNGWSYERTVGDYQHITGTRRVQSVRGEGRGVSD